MAVHRKLYHLTSMVLIFFFHCVEISYAVTWEPEINVKYVCFGEGKNDILNFLNNNESTMHKAILWS